MWFTWILPHILTVLGFALCVILIVRLFRSHHTPGVTMAWLLAILLIPWAGVPAYLLLGGRKIRRMMRRKDALYEVPQQSPSANRASPHITERVLVTAGMPPARGGNRIEFLPHGEAGFAALTSLIAAAKRSVHLMTFLLKRDQTGRAIVDLLARKAAEGVEVRLLLDALGCLRSRGRFVHPIRDAGGQVGIFMPVLPLSRKWSTAGRP
jgi:cardiolipin synthase